MEQRRIAERLLSVEDTLVSQNEALNAAITSRVAYIEDFLARSAKENRRCTLGDYLTDLSYGSSSRSCYENKGYPILRIPNVLRGNVDYSDLQWIELEEAEYNRFAVEKGDVLIVRTNGNPQYVGRSVVIDHLDGPMVYASYLIRLRCNKNIMRPEFLVEFLNAPTSRQLLRGEVKSSAGNYNLNIGGIKKQPICLPQISVQDEIISFLRTIDKITLEIEKRYASTYILKNKMLEIIGGA